MNRKIQAKASSLLLMNVFFLTLANAANLFDDNKFPKLATCTSFILTDRVDNEDIVIVDLVKLILSAGARDSQGNPVSVPLNGGDKRILSRTVLVSELVAHKYRELVESLGRENADHIMQQVSDRVGYNIFNIAKTRLSDGPKQKEKVTPRSVSEDTVKRIVRVIAPSLQERLPGHTSWVNIYKANTNSDFVISVSSDSVPRTWDFATRKHFGSPLAEDSSGAFSAAVSFDEKYAVSSFENGTIRIWNIATRQPVGNAFKVGDNGWANDVAITPDGKYILTASVDKTLRVWDFTTRQSIGDPLRGHEGAVSSVVITSDGKYAISASTDRNLRIWDITKREPVGEPLTGHRRWVTAVAVTLDNKYIVSGSDDKTLRVWDFVSGQPVGEPLKGHNGAVNSVAITPDGKYIFSGSLDKTLRIWNLLTRDPVGEPIHFSDFVTSIAVLSNGQNLLVGLANGEMHLLSIYQRIDLD